MAQQSGAQQSAIVQVAATHGTAVAGGAGDKYAGNIDITHDPAVLASNQIGTGNQMAEDATPGDAPVSVPLSGDATYANAFPKILAAFMGTAPAPTEQTASEGDYKHPITFNTTRNATPLTVARESSTTTTEEVPSAYVQSIGISTPSVPGRLQFNAQLVGDRVVPDSATNTNAVIVAATLEEAMPTSSIIVRGLSEFRINAQGGDALDSGDILAITNFDLQLSQGLELVGEIKGAAGLAAPDVTDLFAGTLTVTLKGNSDNTWLTAQQSETLYKAQFLVEGLQINAGDPRSFSAFFPLMKIITKPSHPTSSPGRNPLTITFQLLKANANPTGMSSTYPYFEIVNTRTTSLLA